MMRQVPVALVSPAKTPKPIKRILKAFAFLWVNNCTKKVGALGVVATLLCQTAFAANVITFKNQRDSILELNILAENKIEGYFTTAVASKTCPDAINKKRPITGYLIGNAITFSVVYPMCESVLSVSGNLDNEKTAIDTISILSKQASDIVHEGPGARLIGHDSYQKIS